MAGNSNLDVLAKQGATQGKNQCKNQGTACGAAKRQRLSFTMPNKDIALDKHVSTSETGTDFKKGIGGC
jgi:hypothetical protein